MLNDKNIKLINACVSQKIPVLLRGETGTGKTTLVRELAESQGYNLTRINLTGQTTREDLVGKYILKDSNLVWQDGALLSALKQAKTWLLLDEINAALPEVLFLLQSLLEVKDKLGNILLVEKDGESVTPHEDCRIFATCNPSDYDGTKDFNMATLSRFAVIDIEPLGYAEEEKLLLDRYAVDIARGLVESANKARDQKKKGETNVFVSTRDLELAARLYKSGVSESDAIGTAIISKCQNENDKHVISTCFDVKLAKSGKSIIEELEELKEENKALKTEAKSASELLKTFRDLISGIEKSGIAEYKGQTLELSTEKPKRIRRTKKQILLDSLKPGMFVKYGKYRGRFIGIDNADETLLIELDGDDTSTASILYKNIVDRLKKVIQESGVAYYSDSKYSCLSADSITFL